MFFSLRDIPAWGQLSKTTLFSRPVKSRQSRFGELKFCCLILRWPEV